MSNAPIILEVQCIACDRTLQKIEHRPCNFRLNMRSSGARRMRTPNWSAREKQFLLELIKEKKDAVVPKNENPSKHTLEKTAAWNDIMLRLVEEFGAKFAGSTIKKVKTQWQNMKRVAREEAAARVVSRQSMEVCLILDEELPPKEEEGGVVVKQEPQDVEPPEFSVTMDITSDTLDQDPFEEPSPSGSPTTSEYLQYSDVDELRLEASDNANRAGASSTSGYAGPSPPSKSRGNGDFGSFATLSLKLKLELMKEERHVLRAMRETAELNKTIAEKRLQQVLWINDQERAMYSGEPGSGAGRGGGGGGSIREAGGAFGKMEAGREEEYFYRKQKQQLESLKTHLHDEISYHEEHIKKHEEAIRRHKEKVADLDKEKK